jgi:hypothetical protein
MNGKQNEIKRCKGGPGGKVWYPELVKCKCQISPGRVEEGGSMVRVASACQRGDDCWRGSQMYSYAYHVSSRVQPAS